MLRALVIAIAVFVVVSTLPVNSSQPSAFADPAFSRYYGRSSATEQQLLWGGGPLASVVEPFTGAPGNRRLVQYFERGRMEITDNGSTTTTGNISQGLLVREMATGNVQLGYAEFVQSEPADVALFGRQAEAAGDPLTYADFAIAVASRNGDRSGQVIDDWIAPGGAVSKDTPPVELQIGDFEELTGHNIPQVTASWLRTNPFGVNTNDALGLPISEPFWTVSGKGTAGISLVQLFERRVIVYTPDMPQADRFSLTSVGRHYYRWRYGNEVVAAGTGSADQLQVVPRINETAGLSLPNGYQAVVVTEATDAVDLTVAPDGKLAIAYANGQIELHDSNNRSSEPTTLVEHLTNPRDFIWAGTHLYVIDDVGLHSFQDSNGDGVSDGSDIIFSDGFERASVRLALGPDGTVYLTSRAVTPSASATATAGPISLYEVEPGTSLDDEVAVVDLDTARVTSLVVDDQGTIWLVDDAGQLVRYQPDTGTTQTLLDASQFTAVRDLVLYRPDGTTGDPHRDMLGLADSRIVRLQPARAEVGATAATANTSPSAIVDFITGFDRPVAMASGLDGALYVLDAGRGLVYKITPNPSS